MNKLSAVILGLFLLSSASSFALCENLELSFEFYLNNTMDDAYDNDGTKVPFVKGDFIVVTDKVFGISHKVEEGTLLTDGAGNFGVTAEMEIYNGRGVSVDLFHDHEVWHEDGLGGTIEYFGKVYDLSEIKNCSFDELFQ